MKILKQMPLMCMSKILIVLVPSGYSVDERKS
jgi:hypothetical protein